MTKHIVLIHRYFSPDTPPYASILHDIAEHLGSGACRVTVLTCQPSYNRSVVHGAPAHEQISANVTVTRWPVLNDRSSQLRKILNMVWFCARLVSTMSRMGQVHAVMAASTPPIAVAAVSCWMARRKKAAFIYHKQDIYPEVVAVPGKRPSRLTALLRWLDACTDRAATKVVVLSEDMAKTTIQRGVLAERIAVINNFDPWHLEKQIEFVPWELDPDNFHVVFAGNLGHFQNLEPIFDALVELRDDPITFHFFGDGSLREELVRRVESLGLTRIRLYGYRPPDEVARFLSERADIGIVSLVPGVIRAAYPSKTMSYLRQGTPILALVEGDSELARTVRAARIGQQVEPSDVSQLVNVLRELARSRSALNGARDRARRLYVEEFSRERRLDDWSSLYAMVLS
jgi:glycosyltransferase involved in cell wall biosynthesis